MNRGKSVGAAAALLIGLSLASSVGCGHSDEEMAAKQARIDELDAQLRQAQRQRQELDGRLREMTAQNEAMAGRLHALGENVGNLRTSLSDTQRALDELRARERQAQERLSTFRNMLERFRAMIASGQLTVRIVRGRMVVVLQENVLFDSGQAQLKAAGQGALTQVAAVLKTITGREFQIAGHTDNLPIRSRRFPSNWELSTARAVTVVRFLAQQGVDAARMSAAGYADSAPAASNDDEQGRAQNRRIEIVLMPNLDELPDLSSLEGAAQSGGAAGGGAAGGGATPPPAPQQPAQPAHP